MSASVGAVVMVAAVVALLWVASAEITTAQTPRGPKCGLASRGEVTYVMRFVNHDPDREHNNGWHGCASTNEVAFRGTPTFTVPSGPTPRIDNDGLNSVRTSYILGKYVFNSLDPRWITATAIARVNAAETARYDADRRRRLAVDRNVAASATALAGKPAPTQTAIAEAIDAQNARANAALERTATAQWEARITAKMNALGLRSGNNCGHRHESETVWGGYTGNGRVIAEQHLRAEENRPGHNPPPVTWNRGCTAHFGTHGTGPGQHTH